MTTTAPNGSQPSLSVAVVQAVADAEGVEPLAVDPPLGRVIDAAALDTLFVPTDDSTPADGSVTFRYAGYEVVVDHAGAVTLRPGPD